MVDRAVLIREIDSLAPDLWDEVLNLVKRLQQSAAPPEIGQPSAGLGERLAGSMKVSPEQYEAMQANLRAWRAEWD